MATEGFDDFMEEIRNGLFGGQVTVTRQYDERIGSFEVTIAPSGENHYGAEFVFEIVMESISGPQIYCQTAIFHPNIDITKDDGKVRIQTDPNWSAHDVVEKLLKLMHRPDFLNSHLKIDSSDSAEVAEFWNNVETSIVGGKVGHYLFPVNEGYARKSTEEEGMELMNRNFGIRQYIPRSRLEDEDNGDGDDDIDDDDDGDDDDDDGDDDDEEDDEE